MISADKEIMVHFYTVRVEIKINLVYLIFKKKNKLKVVH